MLSSSCTSSLDSSLAWILSHLRFTRTQFSPNPTIVFVEVSTSFCLHSQSVALLGCACVPDHSSETQLNGMDLRFLSTNAKGFKAENGHLNC